MKQVRWEKDGYILRLAVKEDADEYYSNNFDPLDPETVRLTGCKPDFTQDEVKNFFMRCMESEDRFDFVIVDPNGHIIGESVLNEIDPNVRCANFRIALFHANQYGKGIGAWAIEKTLQFAFEEICLHRVELDVFSCNPRAIRAYEKAGFKHEGILRDAIKDGDQYADDVLMAILENEWRDIHPMV
ncbi:MAG: GNAT family N-acetyltransferase [Oscillospiraceae bacterium]